MILVENHITKMAGLMALHLSSWKSLTLSPFAVVVVTSRGLAASFNPEGVKVACIRELHGVGDLVLVCMHMMA